jgi:hypothetical protein
VIVILSFFGGLRRCEVVDLILEKFSSTKEGVYVTHNRAKQRSDKRESRFLIPRASQAGELDFASMLETYITLVKEDLGKIVGKVLWTGRHDSLVTQPIGKNMARKVIKHNQG